MELSHAEMQKYHYQALREDPMYRMEFMMDVLREEMMMNMPVYHEPEPPQIIPQKIIVKHHYIQQKESNIKKDTKYIYSNIIEDTNET